MHSCGVKLCNASPTATSSASTVRAAMRSRIDLIFEKGFSIGLKSGCREPSWLENGFAVHSIT
jgi:hypothetical protein